MITKTVTYEISKYLSFNTSVSSNFKDMKLCHHREYKNSDEVKYCSNYFSDNNNN